MLKTFSTRVKMFLHVVVNNLQKCRLFYTICSKVTFM